MTKIEEARELAWTANAYLDCAKRLCTSLIEDEFEESSHHVRVAIHLAYLAIELYFKAALCGADREYPAHHDLATLKRLYDEVMPKRPLPIPSFIDELMPEATEDLFSEDPSWSVARHFPRFRYVKDRKGREYPELDLADLERLSREVEELDWMARPILHELIRRQA